MKCAILFGFLLLTLHLGPHAGAAPSAFDLAGKWEGQVDFGKFKFTLVLGVQKTDEKHLAATLDLPEQGQKGMPVSAVLFNAPDVRFEVDSFGTSYNGKINSDLTEIRGEFEEGPGGRPAPVLFKRSTKQDEAEPEKVYTFSPGEKMDIRGHWKGAFEPMPGMQLTLGMNIGKLTNGTFAATIDVFEQGATDIPASSVLFSNDTAQVEFKALQVTMDLASTNDGRVLTGKWKQGPRSTPVTFQRLESRATAVPKEVSFEPEQGKADDVRGNWKGTLEVPDGTKLRLAMRIGRAPDGSYAATMASLDQGGREIPASSAEYATPTVKLEWKAIRGKFEGKLNQDGTVLDGKWEQFGNPMPLKMERTSAPEAKVTSKS